MSLTAEFNSLCASPTGLVAGAGTGIDAVWVGAGTGWALDLVTEDRAGAVAATGSGVGTGGGRGAAVLAGAGRFCVELKNHPSKIPAKSSAAVAAMSFFMVVYN